MKFKIGDEVIIKSDLSIGEIKKGWHIDENMLKFAGKKSKVIGISGHINDQYYELEIDYKLYGWLDEMLDLHKKKTKQKVYRFEWLDISGNKKSSKVFMSKNQCYKRAETFGKNGTKFFEAEVDWQEVESFL